MISEGGSWYGRMGIGAYGSGSPKSEIQNPKSDSSPSSLAVQIRLSGAGGQGLITAGVILAEAALLEGKYVVQTQSYGPEARLGASKAEVIISSHRIAYPQVIVPDLLLCLSQDSFDRYIRQIHPTTKVILDCSNIEYNSSDDKGEIYPFPITQIAQEVGSTLVANVVALGVMNALEQLVSAENLREAVIKRVPERFRALNEAALEAGRNLIRDAVR